MAPNLTSGPTGILSAPNVGGEQLPTPPVSKKQREYKIELIWRNIFLFIILHSMALYGLYLAFTSAKLISWFICAVFVVFIAIGIAAGAHRLWAHRAYKVNTGLKLFLLFLQTASSQNCVYEWVRDHRVHHKFSETDADPHNATRGFFFAHMGWLCCRKHPDVIAKGRTIDMSDLEADPVIMFQKKYYVPLAIISAFILPTLIPMYVWGESFDNAFYAFTMFRYTLILHATWLVNSAAHLYGDRPYDKRIGASENKSVAYFTIGEGWHNYHHVFPWDYKAAEFGGYKHTVTTRFIDFCARHGWAYDLKSVPADVVKNRIQRTGDGSHPIWGWGDKDMSLQDKELVDITYREIEKDY